MTSIFAAGPRTKASKGIAGFNHVVALLMAVVVSTAFAQTPQAPTEGASAAPGATQTPDAIEAAEAMKRARRLADNPYRWIKIHSNNQRKPESVKPEPVKAEAPRPAPRPSVSPAAAVAREAIAPSVPAQVVNNVTSPTEALTPVVAPLTAASAVEAAVPASAPALAQTAAASAPPENADDVELKPISTPPPEFPRELRNFVSNGRVTVAFTVQPNGRVGATSAESSTNRRLSRAALEAVSQWTFEPISSAVTYKVEFDFKE